MDKIKQGARLLLMGGNNIAVEITRYAKRHYITLVSAGNVPSAEIHKISAEQYHIDITDTATLETLLSEKKIDGIFSCSGEAVIGKTVGFLEQTKYPYYATQHSWDILMNKTVFANMCKKYDLPIIPDYTDDPGRAEYPVVVKPVDNGGSLGISVCKKEDELYPAIQNAIENSGSRSYLIQKFLSGEYFQFDIFIRDGKTWLPYTKSRIFYEPIRNMPAQPFVDLYPSEKHALIKAVWFERLSKMLYDIGVKNGSCMFQGFIENGIPYIMDVAFRLSGGMDFRVVEQATGFDLIGSHLQLALTGVFSDGFPQTDHIAGKHYATICVGLKNGIIGEISGADKLKSIGGVYSYCQNYNIGDEMRNSGLFLQTFCRVFLMCDTKEALITQIEQVMNTIKVKDVKGYSMLLPWHF